MRLPPSLSAVRVLGGATKRFSAAPPLKGVRDAEAITRSASTTVGAPAATSGGSTEHHATMGPNVSTVAQITELILLTALSSLTGATRNGSASITQQHAQERRRRPIELERHRGSIAREPLLSRRICLDLARSRKSPKPITDRPLHPLRHRRRLAAGSLVTLTTCPRTEYDGFFLSDCCII